MLITLLSAKGSPGVTAAAVALAAVWPRPAAVADLDPIGGDLAFRYRMPGGGPLDTGTGLVSLGAELRRGNEVDLTGHLQLLGGGLPVLLGVASPDQVVGLGPVWPRIADVLAQAEIDVLADCGRIGAASPVQPVIAASDLVIAMARDDAAGLAHLRTRLLALGSGLRSAGERVPLAVVLVGGASTTVTAVSQLLESSGLPVAVLGALADDPRGALAVARAETGRAARSSLVRSARGLVPAIMSAARGPALASSG